MAPEKENIENWTEPFCDSEAAHLILGLESTDVVSFNALADRFGPQWLNVIPCKILTSKLPKQQLSVAIGLRLGSKICKQHNWVCGRDVTEEDWHGCSCIIKAMRFSTHSNLSQPYRAEFVFCSYSFCFRATTLLLNRSEKSRLFEARSMGSWYEALVG